MNEIAQVVHEFFARRGKYVESDQWDLYENEIIDSMDLIELIVHLEARLNIDVDQELMTVDNFRTVEKIVSTVGQSMT